jgi:hypothetical protein
MNECNKYHPVGNMCQHCGNSNQMTNQQLRERVIKKFLDTGWVEQTANEAADLFIELFDAHKKAVRDAIEALPNVTIATVTKDRETNVELQAKFTEKILSLPELN